MIPRPPRTTLTDTHLPYTTFFRSRRRHHHRRIDSRKSLNPLLGWRPLALCLADHAHDARERRIRGGPGRDDFESAHAIDGPGKDRCALCDGDGDALTCNRGLIDRRSEEHTSELQSLMRISYAVFCLKKKTN